MKTDNDLFEIAAQEVSNHTVIKGIMARAFSDAMGDKDKSVALYIKYRVADLKEEREIFLQRKNERIKQRKEEDARKQEEANDRERMKLELITICKDCGYAGSMKSSFIPPSDHGFGAATCKCPKCSHRFDWYYVPSEEISKAKI